MGGWLVNALEGIQQALDSASMGQAVLLFVTSLVITPLSVVGHAAAARGASPRPVLNITSDGAGHTDGAKIRAIRAGVVGL